MKLKKYLLIITLLFYGIVSCDVIEEPYTKNDETPSESDSNQPNILLEEFTGHTCIYCPGGSKTAKNLQQQYPEKIFVVAIHAGGLAAPTDEPYSYDFRTTEGNEIDGFYGASTSGLPRGMVNRTLFSNLKTYPASQWGNVVTEFWNKNKISQLDIELSAQCNPSSRTISANVTLDYFVSQSKQNKLSVWILEDNIIQYQKSIDSPFDIPDYQHNDVLRYSFNGAWGEIVTSSTIPIGFKYSNDYELIVPVNKDWNLNNLRVIAFVYDDDNGVKQVMDTKVEIVE